MAEPIAGPRRSRRRATKTRSSRVWQGEREVMQNRSNRGSGKPVWVRAHQAREFDWDPIRRIALGPAVMETASTGRTHDCTRQTCINVKTNLANREPSTHGLPTSSPASRPRSPPWRWPTRTPAPPGHCCTMAEPIAGPRRSRRRATKTRSSRVWQGEREVMQNRSNRGSGKPVWVRAHQAREFDWDPIRRIALGPAVMETASTGRTHDCTRPTCINVKTNLANREPSTHGSGRIKRVSLIGTRSGGSH